MRNKLPADILLARGIMITLGCILIFLGLIQLPGCSKAMPAPPEPRPQVSVIAFTASWCRLCQRAKPALVAIRAAGVYVLIVDVNEHPELVKKFKITSVPTYLVRVGNEIKVTRTRNIVVVVEIVSGNIK